MAEEVTVDQLATTLKRTVAALRDAGIRFAIGGGVAAWARGGPEPGDDLDVIVRRQDADAALQALGSAGMRSERPPEGWLLKAYDGPVLVDLVFAPAGYDDVDGILERAQERRIAAVSFPAIAVEDLLASRLHALDAQSADFTELLPVARALREQVDWARLRELAAESPYARAFLTLVEGLGVAPSAEEEPA